MNSIVFYFSENNLCLFEKNEANEITPFYCKGEEFVTVGEDSFLEDFQHIKEYILESLNLTHLKEIGISLIYHDVGQKQLKSFIGIFTPCKNFEVIHRESVLPDVFYKADILKNREKVSVKIDSETFLVELVEDTKASIFAKTDLSSDLQWKAHDIVTFYYYPLVYDVKPDIETLQETNELKDICNQLQKQVKNEKEIQKELQSHITELQKKMKELLNHYIEVKNQVDTSDLIGKRRFITVPRANERNKSLVYTGGLFGRTFMNNATKKIKWKKLNGDFVKKGDIVAHVMFPDSNRDSILVKSPCDGRLHLVAKENQVVGFDKLIGIVADPRDKHEDVQQWVKTLNN